MANMAGKIKLIIWKDLKIRYNTFIFTIFELVPPVLFVFLIIYLKDNVSFFNSRSVYVNETEYFHITFSPTSSFKLRALHYAPNNTQTNTIMDSVKVSIVENNGAIRGFETESLMVNYLVQLLRNTTNTDYYNYVGIVFNNIPENILPKNLDYRIRAPYKTTSDFVNLLYSKYDPFQPNSNEHKYEFNYYKDSFFLPIQEAVDSAFIKLHKSIEFDIKYQRIPFGPHRKQNIEEENFSAVLPLAIINGYVFNLIHFTRQVLEGKTTGMTELLKMMGLKPWMLRLSWYIHNMITVIPSVIIITVMFKFMLLVQCDGVILGLFLFMYCTSLVCFVFCMCTFFDKPRLGLVIILIVWIVSLYPAYFLQSNNDPASFIFFRYFMFLFPNSCLIYGTKTIYKFECEGSGLTWSNWLQVPSEYVHFHSMGIILLIFLLESLLFMLLTCYISQIKPGQYGIRKPWNFFCKQKEKTETSPEILENISGTHAEIETATPGLQAGIQIRNLHKKFGHISAVNDLSCDIYINMITVLVGHAESGKSTTVNIISGILEPTSGTVLVDGYNIRTQLDNVRASLGLCPQHNIHFANLKVIDHLMLFAMLKGIPKRAAKKESQDYLVRFGLSQNEKVKVATLPEGMKRRLSLCLALIGSRKILILDEPTFGIGTEDRRDIWDILLKMRGSRTILITTHHVEEADILGDRIALMHNGRFLCYGTPIFLNKHYGTGYTLSILVGPTWDEVTIINTIKMFIPNARVKHVSVTTLTVVLPPSDTAALTQLFLELDKTKGKLGISSYSVSLTTMDDVFFRATEETNVAKVNPVYKVHSEILIADPERKYNTGCNLTKQQLWALLVKRSQYYRRRWRTFLKAILLLLALFIFIMVTFGIFRSNTLRTLNLGSYPYAISYYSSVEDNKKLASYYAKAVEQQYSNPVFTRSVSGAILKVGRENVDSYTHKLVTAAEFNVSEYGKITLNAMFGAYAVHSPAISLNLVMNALLKYALEDENFSITTGINPLAIDAIPQNPIVSLIWAMFIPTGLTMLVGWLLIFHVNERLSGVKHLQIMNGVPCFIYWLGNYIFDMFVYICVLFLLVITIVAFRDNVSHFSAILPFTLMMFLFGLSILPFAYFFHYRPNARSAFTALLYIAVFLSVIMPILFTVWKQMYNDQKFVREILQYVFMLFPHYAISNALEKLVMHAAAMQHWDKSHELTRCNQIPKPPCCVPSSEECNFFYNLFKGETSLLTCLIFLSVEAVLYFAIFLIVDYGFFRKYANKIKKHEKSEEEKLDIDVAKERTRVSVNLNRLARLSKSK